MALSAAVQRRYRPWGKSVVQNYRVANGDTIYIGSYVGMPGTKSLTSRRGYATTYRDVQTIEYLGLAIGSPFNLSTTNTIVGDTSASPVVQVTCETGPFIEEQRVVTGVSAQSDVGKAVYLTSDTDMTLTQSQGPATGRVEYWWSSTTCDVMNYGRLAAIVI